jgi:hypothetical protein
MSWNNHRTVKSMKALSSFAGMQYRIVELATSEANACDYSPGGGGYGVIINEPLANEAASVVVDGETQCKAGGTIAIGDKITTATSAAGGPGWATKVVSGDAASGRKIVGIAISGAASGSLFTLDIQRQIIHGVSSAGLVII